MATVLPFNSISVGGTQIAGPDDFIYGSGRLSLKGEDSAVTTADGKIHNFRSALSPEGSCELRGDKRSVGTGESTKWPTMGTTVTFGYVASRGASATTVYECSAILSPEYDAEQNKTTVSIKGDDPSY